MMSSAVKKDKNLLAIDGRGRIAIPREFRKGTDAFTVEPLKDGAFRLVPLQVVSTEDARQLKSLKDSAEDVKQAGVAVIPHY
jgi:hypothetical protein